MTPKEKVANQILTGKETQENKLTTEEAKEYSEELSRELHNVGQLSFEELRIYNSLASPSSSIS
jgi:uncharacterized protein YueI